MNLATSNTRTRSLLDWLKGASSGAIIHFYVATTPAPASRPSINKRGGAFYSKSHEAFNADLRRELSILKAGMAPLEGRLLCFVEVIAPRPPSGKLSEPRGDVDNFLKPPLDAATRVGIWGDDTQLTAAACAKRYCLPGEEPGCNIWIGIEA